MQNPEFLIGDATNISIPDSSVDLIITHPPYIGVDTERYGDAPEKQINFNKKKFLKLLIKSTKEMERVLKSNGSIWICVGGSDTISFDYITEVLKKTNLYLSGWTHWDFSKDERYERLGQDHNIWFHLSKSKDIYFNPFMIRRYHTNTWKLLANNEDNIVDLGLTSDGHFIADSVPESIPSRLIEMFTKPNGIVLDPFGGTGVVAIQAWKQGRKGISIDISVDQKEIAEKRFKYSQ